MRRSKVFSNIVMFSVICIFMLTVVPMCTVDRIDLVTELPTDESSPLIFPQERAFTEALDEMPLRMDADLVYDSESDRMIFFGGATKTLEPNYNDTWSYDYNTNTWTQMDPAVAPPATDWHQMAYHSGQDKVVLFGGHVSGHTSDWHNHNETWTYDLNTDTWTNMAPASAPPALCAQTMAYDSESDLIVLFGGSGDDWYSNNHMYSDTWTYDLTSNTWTNVTTSIHPSPRSWPAMAYDVESDLMVLFGGWEIEPITEDWVVLNDTWTYDANTNTWAEIVIPDGPDSLGDLVYDSESDRMVFFGGALSLSELVEDLVSETWSYDTNTETWELMDPIVEPPVRSRVQATYDSESDVMLLFGGVIDGGWPTEEVRHDCWAYDLNKNLWDNVDWNWQEMTPAFSPDPVVWPAMTYDSESDLVVLFGGGTEESYQSTGYYGDNETWTYDYNTNTWTNMSPTSGPSMRVLANMVYDEESDIIILFGGGRFDGVWEVYGDTWAYDVNTNTWANMSPAVAPSNRWAYQMTYDSKADLIVMYSGIGPGGDNIDETWTYDYNSNTWTLKSPAVSPEERNAAAFAYDEDLELCVLFGGYIMSYPYELDDTWVYNTTADTWTEMSPSSHPSRRSELRAVYDANAEGIIIFGGWAYTEKYDETWTYNYTENSWIRLDTGNAPSARYWYGIAFDSESERTIVFSGNEGLEGVMVIGEADTWAYKYEFRPITAPNPPQDLAADGSGNAPVITWKAPVPISGLEVTGYNVYREDSGVYTKIAELGNVLTYTDLSAGFGITYTYVATALSDESESKISNSDSCLIPLEPYDDGIYTFIAYGDTRAGDESAVAAIHDDLVSKYMQQHDPEMIIHSGDMVYHGGEAYQWPLFNDSISAMWNWHPDIEFFGAAGNHEMYTDDWVNDPTFTDYLAFVDFSAEVDTSAGETELYFSFDRNGIHFIILNTVNDWVGDDYSCPQAQMDWLEADLAGDYETIIVTTHYPSYSILAGRPERLAQAESVRDEFHDLFVEYGVDIVFTGHNHYYYRTARDGIQYVTAAGGGAPLYGIDKTGTHWQEGDVGFGEYHYCVCSIDTARNVLVVETVLMNRTVADSFEITLADVTDPTIDHPSDIEYEEGSTGYSIVWHPSDLNPDRFELYKDDLLVNSGSWDGSSITVSVDGLSVGSYNYTVVVFDTSDNSNSDTVIVTVTSPSTEPPPFPMEIIVIASGAVVVVILLVIVLRKRK
jgi:N-acetylneuraminic acid mutarotase